MPPFLELEEESSHALKLLRQAFFWAILWRLIEALASEGLSFFSNSLSYFGHILELFLKIKGFLQKSL